MFLIFKNYEIFSFKIFIFYKPDLKGIKAPFWFRDTFINTVGHREAERALQLGLLYTPEEALKIKLVDEIAEPSTLMLRAEEEMQNWCKIPVMARELTKSSMRREAMSNLIAQKESDIQEFVDFASREYVQKSLKTYLDALKKPKKV